MNTNSLHERTEHCARFVPALRTDFKVSPGVPPPGELVALLRGTSYPHARAVWNMNPEGKVLFHLSGYATVFLRGFVSVSSAYPSLDIRGSYPVRIRVSVQSSDTSFLYFFTAAVLTFTPSAASRRRSCSLVCVGSAVRRSFTNAMRLARSFRVSAGAPP